MQARDRLYKQQKSSSRFWLSVSLCLWTVLSTLPYLNHNNGVYLATICSGEGEHITIVDGNGQPIKSETWCLDCIVQISMSDPSFSFAELILNEHKAAYNAPKADFFKPQAVQHYYQTGPPEIV